jgi:hypothetical protein
VVYLIWCPIYVTIGTMFTFLNIYKFKLVVGDETSIILLWPLFVVYVIFTYLGWNKDYNKTHKVSKKRKSKQKPQPILNPYNNTRLSDID